MPNSLRAKLSKLRYKGEITQEEYAELIKKLDGHDSELLDKVAKVVKNRIDSYNPSYTDIYNVITELSDVVLNAIAGLKSAVEEVR